MTIGYESSTPASRSGGSADREWASRTGDATIPSSLRRARAGAASFFAKRTFDVILGSLGLLALAPLFLVIAMAVKLSSAGPVMFRQERVGKGGKLFVILKFRTMRANDDSDRTWSVGDDPRVTTVGRMLRRTSLDELPQLINVLRGHMSLVGPRPERPFFVSQFQDKIPYYLGRHRVLPGITGWAQVHGLRGDTSIQERVAYDNHYIDHRTIWLDLRILARTVGQVVSRSGR